MSVRSLSISAARIALVFLVLFLAAAAVKYFKPKPLIDRSYLRRTAEIQNWLGDLVEGEDHYHRTHGRYTAVAESLMVRNHQLSGRPYRPLELSDVIRVRIAQADSIRWRAVLTHDSLPGVRCEYSDSVSNRVLPPSPRAFAQQHCSAPVRSSPAR